MQFLLGMACFICPTPPSAHITFELEFAIDRDGIEVITVRACLPTLHDTL